MDEVLLESSLLEIQEMPRFYDPSLVHIDNSARNELLGWIFSLAEIYDLTDDTVLLASHIIDVSFTRKVWGIGQYQLVAGTSFFIAARYGESFYPALSELVYLCDGLYKEKDFILMQNTILSIIDYRLSSLNYSTLLLLMTTPLNPPEEFLKCMSFIVRKSISVKGITQVHPKIVADTILCIIESGLHCHHNEENFNIKKALIDVIKAG